MKVRTGRRVQKQPIQAPFETLSCVVATPINHDKFRSVVLLTDIVENWGEGVLTMGIGIEITPISMMKSESASPSENTGSLRQLSFPTLTPDHQFENFPLHAKRSVKK